jgi:hypothetical protein
MPELGWDSGNHLFERGRVLKVDLAKVIDPSIDFAVSFSGQGWRSRKRWFGQARTAHPARTAPVDGWPRRPDGPCRPCRPHGPDGAAGSGRDQADAFTVKPAFTLNGGSAQDPLKLAIPAPGEYLLTTRVDVTSPVDAATIWCRLVKDNDDGVGPGFTSNPLAASAPTVVIGESRIVVNRETRVECAGTSGVALNVSKIELLAKRFP